MKPVISKVTFSLSLLVAMSGCAADEAGTDSESRSGAGSGGDSGTGSQMGSGGTTSDGGTTSGGGTTGGGGTTSDGGTATGGDENNGGAATGGSSAGGSGTGGEANPDAIVQVVNDDGETLTLNLIPYSIRGPQFEVLYQDDSGQLLPYEPDAPRTYFGTVTEYPDAIVAAMAMSDGELRARIYFDRGHSFETSDDEVIARAGDEDPVPVFPTQLYSTWAPVKAATDTVYQTVVAIDASNPYTQRFSSNAETFEAIEWDIAQFHPLYLRDALLEPTIGRVILRNSSTQCPYTTGGYALVRDFLPAVSAEWQANQMDTPRTHAGVIWPDLGGGVAGGPFSPNGVYAVLSPSGDSFSGLARHEFCHNWGVGDSHAGCPEGKASIMCGNRSARFSGTEVFKMLVIRDFELNRTTPTIVTRSFVDLGYQTTIPYPPYAMLDIVQLSQGSGDVQIDVLDNDHDANGDAISLSGHDPESNNGQSVSAATDPGAVIYSGSAQPVGTTDYFYYTIVDENGQTATGLVVIGII